MAQFTGVVVALLICINYLHCLEINVVDQKRVLRSDIIQLVSHILKNESDIFSSTAVSPLNIVGGPPDENFLIQLDVHASCIKDIPSGCTPLIAICELNISSVNDEDLETIVEKGLKCAEKEPRPILPAGDKGFVDVDNDAEVRDIAEYAIRQLEEGGDQRKSVLDIMSVKKDSQQSGTRFYLTVKVTATDEGDASHLEVCELDVNQTSDVTLQSDGICFPLGDKQDSPLSEEHVDTEAKKVVAHLGDLSSSNFIYSYKTVIRAEQSVTPGSEGVLSTYELRMVPSICLKTEVEASDGQEDWRKCLASNSSEITCVVTSWERPWLGDMLFSRPDCHVTTDDVKTTTNVDALSVEVTTLGEPEAEALVARDQEETPVPVIEEPFVARQVSCVGCPLDLNLDSPALDEFIELALVHLDDHSKTKYVHQMSRITKAQRQVVNGIKYILYMQVFETSCLKGSENDRQLCEPKPDSEVQTCVVEFMEKPWLDTSKHVESNNCTDDVSDLDNEIIPEYISRDNADKQEILDYLDALDDPYFERGFADHNFDLHHQEAPPDPTGRTEPPVNERKLYLTNDDLDALNQFGISADSNKPELEVDTDTSGSSTEEQRALLDGKQSGSNVGEQDESSSGSTESKEVTFPSENADIAKSSMEHSDASFKEGSSEELEVSSDRERRNTLTVGELREFNKEDKDLVNELAQIAVATLDELDADDTKRVVLEIVDAKKQIVDGILYHLTIRVGFTSCKEDSSSPPDCMKDSISSRVCKVQLHRAFAGDKKAKVVQSECGGDADGQSATFRTRRSVVGGIQPSSVSDPDIVRVVNTALPLLTQDSTGFANRPCYDTIHNASTQVVAGILYRFTMTLRESTSSENHARCPPDNDSDARICSVEVLEQLWAKTFEVNNVSCAPASRTRRAVVPGGRSPVSVDDQNVQRLTSLAMAQLAQSPGSANKVLIHVVKAEKQVVGGLKWYITFKIGQQNVPTETCDLVVYERPWQNYTEVQSLSCSPINSSRKRRSSTDNSIPIPVSPDNEDVEEAAKFALSQLDHTTTSPNAQFLVQIKEVHSQVVNEDKFYFLLLEVGESTCPKNSTAVRRSCQRLENVPTQHCHVDVLVHERLGSRQLINSVCGPADTVSHHVKDALANSVQRLKRSHSLLVGSSYESQPDDEYIQELATFATSELDKTSGSEYAMKKVRVVSARTQIVSGKLVHLTLEVGFSNCRNEDNTVSDPCELKSNTDILVCHVDVWDQSWTKQRKLTAANCDPQYSVHSLKKRATVSHSDLLGKFEHFIYSFNKTYHSKTEYKRRYHIFKANMKKVELLQETERGTAKYGATQFADLTAKEFKTMFLGLNVKKRHNNVATLPMARIPKVDLPVNFDWRHYNAVTPVKNQGSCGSCWAFSVTGNIEGQWAINRGKLLSLSEQELVDCDKMDDGCSGGEMVTAYEAIEKLGGLETESEYPYEGDDESCHFNRSEVRATITGAVNLTKNETQMAQWLLKNGPISIGINANAMQFYFGGVSHPWKALCNPDNLDHGVLIVGFGVHKTKYLHKILPYWIVKNSWGTSWGEKGYYRVFRGDGTCGVNQMATSAVVV